MRRVTCTFEVVLTVDADKAEGDEFEMALAAVHDCFADFRLDAVIGAEIATPDDLAVPM